MWSLVFDEFLQTLLNLLFILWIIQQDNLETVTDTVNCQLRSARN